MAEKMYVVPVLLTVPAESYEKAREAAEAFVDSNQDAGIGLEVETYFERDDIGQRVMYLHPEEDPDYENVQEDDG